MKKLIKSFIIAMASLTLFISLTPMSFAQEEEKPYFVEIYETGNMDTKSLKEVIPGVYEGFGALAGSVLTDGALDVKTKELCAITLAVSSQCEKCITAHTMNLLKLGVSREEFAEAIAVNFLMGGGPSTVYAAKALAAYDQLSEYYADEIAAALAEKEAASEETTTKE